MKKLLFVTILLTVFSCKTEKQENENPLITQKVESIDKTTTESEAVHKESAEVAKSSVKIQEALLGSYVGKFTASKYDYDKKPSFFNKINITITLIQENKVKGYSVVAGNKRPFKGTIDSENLIIVKEPGDDKYDGVFKFKCSEFGSELKGIWIANDANLAVPERKFKLEKRVFQYNADQFLAEIPDDDTDGYSELDFPFASLSNDQYHNTGELEALTWDAIKINASNTLLKKEDVENLYKGDLEIIRNTIYARHGYSFKNRKIRYFFDMHIDWYMPVSTDIRKELTEIEKKNIELIKRYEEHADKYYDYFGR